MALLISYSVNSNWSLTNESHSNLFLLFRLFDWTRKAQVTREIWLWRACVFVVFFFLWKIILLPHYLQFLIRCLGGNYRSESVDELFVATDDEKLYLLIGQPFD